MLFAGEGQALIIPIKDKKNDQKRPKTTENDQKRPKTTENDQKRPKTTENDRKRPKLVFNFRFSFLCYTPLLPVFRLTNKTILSQFNQQTPYFS